MATNLTGDFDVVAQFAIPAVNRILAAMHRIERFPHSLAMRVDDTSPPDHGLPHFSVIGVLDVFGDPVSDHSHIGNPVPVNIGDFNIGSSTGAVASALGAIANPGMMDALLEALQPSHLKGRAQVQVFPPTIEVTDASGNKLTVRMEIIARYLPDPGTPQVAQFIRGELRITTSVSQVVAQDRRVISIDVKASSAVITFTPLWSSSPISAQDLAGITLLIRNALRTGFLPSNAAMPTEVGHIQFKTVSGGHPAVAVLIDMEGDAGNPASASQSFLVGSDGFAFGIGADYIQRAFQPTLTKILEKQVDPVKFDIDGYVHTWHITYIVTLNSATLELQNGKMVLVIKGHAHTGTSWLPDFNFTLKQDIMIAVSGPDAELSFGAISFDTSSTIVDLFKSRATANIARIRDAALAESGAQATVSNMLSAEKNLGNFLRSLLTPAKATPPVQPLDFSLSYSSAEIRTTGIILHGIVGVPAWPPPRVEYEVITPTPGIGIPPLPTDTVDSGPDYSALKSWIPGGTIRRFEWHRGSSPAYVDENKFVFLHQPPPLTTGTVAARSIGGYAPFCLTIEGTRLSSSGPVTTESVGATVCGYRSFPLFDDIAIDGATVALARSGSGGLVDIIGHAAPMSASAKAPASNLIVHFAGERSEESIDHLTDALQASGRDDAPTAIIVVASAGQLARLQFNEGVAYSDDDERWRKRYGVEAGNSATLVIDPAGKIAWRKDGGVGTEELASALRKVLVKTAPAKATMLTSNARVGQPAPNFLFDYAQGHQLTLHKIAGRPVTVVFFRGASAPSIEAVREAAGRSAHTVLAVTDGDKLKEREFGRAIVVHDRGGRISAAYGITMWPTIIEIDESGIVRHIAYGRATTGEKTRA